MKLRTTLLAATAMALPLAAQAQPVSGLYVGAGAGVNFLGHQTQSASTDPFELCDYYCRETTVNGRWNQSSRKPGFVALSSVGWGFGNGLRAEVEGSWRANSVRGSLAGINSVVDGHVHPSNDGQGGSIRGRTDQYAAMINGFYDFNNISPMVVPYIGVGVGYAWQRYHGLQAGGEGGGYVGQDFEGGWGAGFGSNSSVGRFAYQAIAGAAFPIGAVPGLSLTAEYRFMGTVGSQNLSVNGSGGTSQCNQEIDGCDGNGNGIRKSRVSAPLNHSILVGVRYEFNKAPAPAPVAAAAPVPAGRSFMVFFDWDRFNLTDRARAVIRDAAATSKTTQHTRLEVNGYADTSGNPKYNMGLSMKRAQTVAAELVRNGVAKNEIVIKAFGDTVLLVPTGPGVREPQNRRVEIIIR